MASTTPAPGVHLDDNGTARLVFDDLIVTLRRPKMSEYTELVDVTSDIDHQILAIRPKLSELNKKIMDGSAHDKQRAEARDLSRQVQTAKAPIIVKVCELLGGEKVDPDELPPWAQASGSVSEIMGRLFTHWETVPFHGSAQSES